MLTILAVKEDTILFSVNPYGYIDQTKVVTINVTTTDKEKVYGNSTSHLQPNEWIVFEGFASDMINAEKEVFDNLLEAMQYLDLVRSGAFARTIKEYHASIENMFGFLIP